MGRTVAALTLAFAVVSPALAQTLPSAQDRTGTNPLNLQPTVELRNTFVSLQDELFFNETVYRYSRPFLARRMSASLDVPLVATDVTGRSQIGFGDLAAAWSWIALAAERSGLRVGAELAWSTATRDALGTGKHVLAPFTIVAFSPVRRVLIAPGYQQRVSYAGDDDRFDVNEGTLDLYCLVRLDEKEWVIVDPRVTFDYERDRTSGAIAFQYGRLMFGGASTWIQPEIGMGAARRLEWKLAVGFRIVFE